MGEVGIAQMAQEEAITCVLCQAVVTSTNFTPMVSILMVDSRYCNVMDQFCDQNEWLQGLQVVETKLKLAR